MKIKRTKEIRAEEEEPEVYRKRLGSFLMRLREEKQVSIQKVSRETGISDPFLYQIEKGEKSLTKPDYFNRLAQFYGIKVEQLLKLAGYLPMADVDAELEAAVQVIMDDKEWPHLNKTFFAKLDFMQKSEIVSLYENATKKKIATPLLRALR